MTGLTRPYAHLQVDPEGICWEPDETVTRFDGVVLTIEEIDHDWTGEFFTYTDPETGEQVWDYFRNMVWPDDKPPAETPLEQFTRIMPENDHGLQAEESRLYGER